MLTSFQTKWSEVFNITMIITDNFQVLVRHWFLAGLSA
jgi:hypothetical protein